MSINKIYALNDSYKDKTDEEIIKLIKAGDNDALNFLIDKYNNVVNLKVNKYFIIGAEREDIVQEGLIGLFKAIKNFDEEKQNSFKTFANLCVERQLITAIKSSNRQKHVPLNSSVSLNAVAYEENDDTDLIEVFNSNTSEDPLDTITKKEYYKFIQNRINKTLSDFERRVLNYYSQGQSYVEIANKLDMSVKSIDNAIQRIRKKATKNIMDDEED